MRVAGLDLSLTGTGICVATDTEHLHSLTVKTKLTGPARLAYLRDRVLESVGDCDLAVIEEQAHDARNMGVVIKIAGLHAVIAVALHEWNVPVAYVRPASLKKYASGQGDSKKEGMLLAAYKHFGREFATNDECDAYFLALMGLEYAGSPVLTVKGKPMPQASRDVVAKVEWPPLRERG